MNLNWIDFSNPVALWWIFLVTASILNVMAWSWTKVYLYRHSSFFKFNILKLENKNIIWYSSAYVFGCAYRSIFVKADVLRICLFDGWLSSVFLGRSVATLAELCFVAQWAIVINSLACNTNNKNIQKISKFIIPLIFIAELFSWYAVISTNYLGNMIEESLWTVTYSLIAWTLFKLRKYFVGAFKYAINLSLICNIAYILFMIFVDVSMYFHRWLQDRSLGKTYLSFKEGIIDLNTRWVVTHNISDWRSEIPWMTLYFSFAVLVSIGLCYIPSDKDKLRKHLRHH